MLKPDAGRFVIRSIHPIFLLLVFVFVNAMACPVFAASDTTNKQQVNNVRLWQSPTGSRVVFDVSADVGHSMFILKDPLRLVIDIEDADLLISLPAVAPDNPHIAGIRSGRPKAGLLRFVLELKKELSSSSFVLSPNELYGHRLVVDLNDESAPSVPAAILNAGANSDAIAPSNDSTAEPEPKRVPQSTTTANLPQVNRPILIAIDAGHGGEDPGATGYRGSREKKITLSIAKKLKEVIDRDPNMQSFLVRTGDYYIKLHNRRLMARQANADMFISIHADAFKRRSARGFSVFALSQRGATSAMARALAAKENASDLIGGVSLVGKDEVLAKVLVDLSMTNTISESVNLGGRVLTELGKLGKLHSKRVEQAGFAVLKSADMPSILVETGFITNPDEERNLRTNSYQRKVANAIYKAVNNYYQQTPYYANARYASPKISSSSKGSSNIKTSRPRYHKVVRGDSLSKIAQKYGVSGKEIKRLNKIRNNTVMLGTRLKLPGGNSVVRSSSVKPAVHTVKRGDSLSKISAQYNVTLKSLKRLNNLKKNTVYIGQKIKLPGGATVAVKTPKKHKVKRGDTLSEIAEKYDSSISKIMRANKMRSRTVMLGQVLTIPN